MKERDVYCTSCRTVWRLPDAVEVEEAIAWMRWHSATGAGHVGQRVVIGMRRDLPVGTWRGSVVRDVAESEVLRAVEYQRGWNSGHAQALEEMAQWIKRKGVG